MSLGAYAPELRRASKTELYYCHTSPQWSRIAQIDLVHAAVLVSVETSIRDVFGKLELDDLDVCDDFDEALMDLGLYRPSPP